MKTENILPDLTTPRVMAIVNVTPDSFFAGSRTPDAEAIERRVREAADAGCDLFDVGGYSSRAGAAEVTSEEEWRRVEAGVAAVRRIGSHTARFGRYVPCRGSPAGARNIRPGDRQ